MPKKVGNNAKKDETPPTDPPEPMGLAPNVLAKRFTKQKTWCPVPNIEYDAMCDADNPKTVACKDIVKAAAIIKEDIPRTPLRRSRCCATFGMNLHYKIETLHRTGSFMERAALTTLKLLNTEQRCKGIITASLGNWAMALAYYGRKLDIRITVVLPTNTLVGIVDKCREYGAIVILHGENLAEAKHEAFLLVKEDQGITYINGYDHPSVIAGDGTIGLEILEQLPQTEVILVPIGGGGLIAGIAAAVKHIKPEILIYGVESDKCCSFFKAMDNDQPYKTAVSPSVADSLAVPTAGCNAFHTAKSLINKMILVDDDWITRAVLHFEEEEKLIVEGAGATALSALLAVPDILPEIKEKTVVCVITGGNIDNVALPRCLERAKVVEGRFIKLTVMLSDEGTRDQLSVFSMIANVGCNVVQCYTEHPGLEFNDYSKTYLHIVCETKNLEHGCSLKRVMERLFPDICDFVEEPFSPLPICVCYPKRRQF